MRNYRFILSRNSYLRPAYSRTVFRPHFGLQAFRGNSIFHRYTNRSHLQLGGAFRRDHYLRTGDRLHYYFMVRICFFRKHHGYPYQFLRFIKRFASGPGQRTSGDSCHQRSVYRLFRFGWIDIYYNSSARIDLHMDSAFGSHHRLRARYKCRIHGLERICSLREHSRFCNKWLWNNQCNISGNSHISSA